MLNLELEEKNEQLELNLRERERDEEYLYNIFESLKSGVVVGDVKGKLKLLTGQRNGSQELLEKKLKGTILTRQ